MKDLHNNVKIVPAVNAVTSITNETLTSVEVDLAGHKSAEFSINYGNKTDGAVAVELQESDVSGSGFVAVADADLLPAGTGQEAAVSAADGTAFANTVKKLGYRGGKRYLKLVLITSSNAGSCPVSAVAILGHANHAPVA